MDYAIAGAKEGVKAFLKAFKPAEILFALIIVFFWLKEVKDNSLIAYKVTNSQSRNHKWPQL